MRCAAEGQRGDDRMYRGGFGGRRTGRRGGRDQNYYLATMLVTQVVRRLNELERKPPFTILLLGLCAAAHYTEVRDWLPSVGQACLRPERLHPGESMLGIFNPVRMIFSSLLHANEYHLYHNCISLLNKGVQLELRHKPLPFAAMTCFLLGASSGLYVLISHLGVAMLGLTPSCAIGFSAVLFGYKVVAALESGHTGEQTFFGLGPPGRASPGSAGDYQVVHPRLLPWAPLRGARGLAVLSPVLTERGAGSGTVHGQKEAGPLFCTGYCEKYLSISSAHRCCVSRLPPNASPKIKSGFCSAQTPAALPDTRCTPWGWRRV